MYKILIVDDEKLLRQGFISMTDWNKHGFEIIGEASNGKEAIEKIKTLSPNIVVADVKMPIMDGIELTRYIKGHYPNMEVVILSSFDTFSYVKETMKLGAADYILKPTMEYIELLQILKRISDKLDKNISIDTTTSLDTKTITPVQSFANYCTDNSQRLIYDNYIVLIIYDIEKDITQTFLNINDSSIIYLPYSNSSNHKIVCLVNFEDKYINNIKSHLKTVTQNFINNSWMFISDVYNNIDYTQNKYNKLIQKLDYRFYLEKNNLIGEDYTLSPIDFFSIDFKPLTPMINKRDYAGIRNHIITSIQNILSNNDYMEENNLKNSLIETYFYIKNNLSEDYDMSEISFQGPEHLRLISEADTYSTLITVYDKILSSIFDHIEIQRNKIFGGIIGDIIDYIENNYDKNITLSTVSETFHINKSYLCELFKQQTGENFSKYISNLRIEKAKKLLRKSNYSIYEISEMVGYKDSSYFGKVFKNVTGISPLKYSKVK